MVFLGCAMEENNVRVGKVKFLGLCLNCGKMLEITDFLTVEEKQGLVKKQGIRLDGGNAVCKYVPPIEYCIACSCR